MRKLYRKYRLPEYKTNVNKLTKEIKALVKDLEDNRWDNLIDEMELSDLQEDSYPQTLASQYVAWITASATIPSIELK